MKIIEKYCKIYRNIIKLHVGRIITPRVILPAAGGLGVHTEIQNYFLKRIISSRFHCVSMLERRQFVSLGPNKQVPNPFAMCVLSRLTEMKIEGRLNQQEMC